MAEFFGNRPEYASENSQPESLMNEFRPYKTKSKEGNSSPSVKAYFSNEPPKYILNL